MKNKILLKMGKAFMRCWTDSDLLIALEKSDQTVSGIGIIRGLEKLQDKGFIEAHSANGFVFYGLTQAGIAEVRRLRRLRHWWAI